MPGRRMRSIIAGLTLVLLSGTLAAEAQQAGKVWRIGLLDYGAPDPARMAWWKAFRERLRELGYTEGQNVTFQPRWAHGQVDRLPQLAAELVALKVDILVTGSNAAALAAKRATSSIPIVTRRSRPNPWGWRFKVSACGVPATSIPPSRP